MPLLQSLILGTYPFTPQSGAGPVTESSLTFTGDPITDAVRAAGVEGDGLPIGSGTGIWPALTPRYTTSFPDWSGWSSLNAVLSNPTDTPKFGSTYGRVTWNNAGTQYPVFHSTTISGATAGLTLTLPLWLRGRGANIGKQIRIRVTESGGAQPAVNYDKNVTLTADWAEQFQAITVAENDRTSVIYSATRLDTAGGLTADEAFDIDGLMLIDGLISQPFTPTSRTAARVQADVADLGITATQGSFFMAMTAGVPSSLTSVARTFNWIGSGDNRILHQFGNAANQTEFNRRAVATTAFVNQTTSWATADNVSFAGKWDAAGYTSAFNGGAFATAAAETDIPTLAATLNIGSTATGGNSIRSNIRWMAFFAAPISNADNAALHALGASPPTWATVQGATSVPLQALWRCVDNTLLVRGT